MLIEHVRLDNIMATERLEFKAGKFVQISGPNASGKSTVLEAIKSVVKGGHDATLLREGQEKGEIVLVLDNGMELTKTIRPGSSDLQIKIDGRRQPRPKELLEKLIDELSNNPVAFLAAKKEDRVDTLLTSMPLSIDLDYLSQISGVHLEPSHMHAYQVLEFVYQTVFDERTKTKGAVDAKKKTINQLREAIPAAPEGTIGGEEELEAKLTEIDAQKDTDLTGVHEKLQKFVGDMNTLATTKGQVHDAELQAYTDVVDAEIAELQRQLEAKREERRTTVVGHKEGKAETLAAIEKRKTDVTAKANARRDEIKAEHLKARTPFETDLNVLRANRDLASRRKMTLETIAELEGELAGLDADVKRQNKALDEIKDYRSKVLDNLPIRGLEVRGGEIYRDEVVFERLNKAQRVDIAVEIAALRAGELGVVCVDEIENLDSATFEALQKRVAATKLQFFVTKVSDKPFLITTDAPNF